MVDIGKGVMVDFPDKPSIFLIQGYGEIRVQKSNTRINGVTEEQFKIMLKALKKRGVDDGQEHNTADATDASSRKTWTARSRGSKPRKGSK